jgi:DtxR family Mn-dependent transcriptional regulator
VPTPVVEDYLDHIYLMHQNGQRVIGARLAERIGTAMPTVTETLRRMAREGLVTLDEHKAISLTAKGQETAESLVRRHALAERLLTDVLGLSWAEAHAEAHKFEHIISPRVEARLKELLGDPDTCPHGNPIPGPGHGSAARGLPLTDVREAGNHQVLRVAEDAENDVELMEYIEQRKLKPGAAVYVRARAAFDPVLIEIGGEQLALSDSIAESIFVDEAPS